MAVLTVEPGAVFVKDPDAERIIQFDWTDYLAVLDETLAGSSMLISGPDNVLTMDNDSVVTGNLQTQARVLGGTPGSLYTLTNRIVTDGTPSQTDDRSVQIFVEER